MRNMKRYVWVAVLAPALIALGCKGSGSRSDSQIATDVQNKIVSDNGVPDKQITINSNQGVVTLSGTVSSDAARTAAGADAGQISGVKTVVNNLEVASPTTTAANLAPPQQGANNAPAPDVNNSAAQTAPIAAMTPSASHAPEASARVRGARYSQRSSGGNNSNYSGNNGSSAAQQDNSNGATAQSPAAPPAPTPPPPPQKVTIPAGTQLSIRVNEEVSSEKAQVGDTFHGSISAPVTIDDQTVIPTSADVEGRVVDVKSAGRFAGGSVLTLQLTKLTMNGRSYSIQTDQWSKSGKGKGKGTAEKVGGGAAVGAILGGIFGGGKGAAIGTAAGAGAGTAGSAIGKGQQIVLQPEAVIAFTLQNSLTVTPGSSRQPMN